MDEDDLRPRLEWLLENIDLQIEDIELSETGYQPSYFYDSGDVEDAMLGLQAYAYSDEEPAELRTRVQKLLQPESLVRCLLAGGWLGQIEMLPPHQAEFLRGLKVEFGVGLEMNHPEEVICNFLNALGFSQERGSHLQRLHTLKSSELLGVVRERAGRAVDVFKALECVRGTWVVRFAEWRNEGLLELRPLHLTGIDYNQLTGSKVFYETKKAFDRERPRRGPANFSDSMAITILSQYVEALKSGRGKKVPRFFVATQLWRNVLAEVNANVVDSLRYETPRGKVNNVFRYADYYFFKAVFQPVQSKSSLTHEYRTAFGDLRDLRSKIATILEAPAGFTPEMLDAVILGERTLAVLIEEIKSFSFFEKIWLPFSGEEAAKKVMRFLDLSSRQLTQRRFIIGVERAIQETKDGLDRNLEAYRQANRLWTRVSTEVERLRDKMKQAEASAGFVFRDLGLLRFGFSESVEQKILDTFDTLWSEADDDKPIGAVMRGMSGRERKDYDKEVTAAILWVLKLDNDLVDIVEALSKADSAYSLRLIGAAAIFRARSKDYLRKGESVINDLETLYSRSHKLVEKGDLACGLAYLHFRVWKARGGFVWWRDSPKVNEDLGMKQAWRSAVAYAKEASECSALSSMKRLYALNQYLYYLVEGAGDNELLEMIEAKDSLLEEKIERVDLWGYRYDDTIARYFHRCACLARSEEDWDSYMQDAIRYSGISVENARGDEEVVVYNTRLREQYRSRVMPRRLTK